MMLDSVPSMHFAVRNRLLNLRLCHQSLTDLILQRFPLLILSDDNIHRATIYKGSGSPKNETPRYLSTLHNGRIFASSYHIICRDEYLCRSGTASALFIKGILLLLSKHNLFITDDRLHGH